MCVSVHVCAFFIYRERVCRCVSESELLSFLGSRVGQPQCWLALSWPPGSTVRAAPAVRKAHAMLVARAAGPLDVWPPLALFIVSWPVFPGSFVPLTR